MNNVTLTVEHYISIVTVFELQKESQDAVSSHADDEVSPSLEASQVSQKITASHEDGLLSTECLLKSLRLRQTKHSGNKSEKTVTQKCTYQPLNKEFCLCALINCTFISSTEVCGQMKDHVQLGTVVKPRRRIS